MTAGISGSYAINGTELLLQPTSGRWIDRTPLGFTGNGHPEYAGVREFEMRWQLSPMSDANQVYGLFQQLDVTGTAVMDLPKYKATPYQFYSYSGTTLSEPSSGEYFERHESEIVLIVYGIIT